MAGKLVTIEIKSGPTPDDRCVIDPRHFHAEGNKGDVVVFDNQTLGDVDIFFPDFAAFFEPSDWASVVRVPSGTKSRSARMQKHANRVIARYVVFCWVNKQFGIGPGNDGDPDGSDP